MMRFARASEEILANPWLQLRETHTAQEASRLSEEEAHTENVNLKDEQRKPSVTGGRPELGI
jgi:hypothetical protein